jgi:hypothetical protein
VQVFRTIASPVKSCGCPWFPFRLGPGFQRRGVGCRERGGGNCGEHGIDVLRWAREATAAEGGEGEASTDEGEDRTRTSKFGCRSFLRSSNFCFRFCPYVRHFIYLFPVHLNSSPPEIHASPRHGRWPTLTLTRPLRQRPILVSALSVRIQQLRNAEAAKKSITAPNSIRPSYQPLRLTCDNATRHGLNTRDCAKSGKCPIPLTQVVVLARKMLM